MLNVLMCLSILLVLISCGEESGSYETSTISPEGVSNETFEETLTSSEKDVISGVEQKESGKTANEGACLSECKTPERAAFSFGSAFSVTPADCDTTRLNSFDISFGILLIYIADCGQGKQLYIRKSSYDGTDLTSPSLVSVNCSWLFYNVIDMAAARGANGFVLVYSCEEAYPNASSIVVKIDLNGDPKQSKVLETFKTQYSNADRYLYQVKYNPVAEEFGVGRAGALLRVDNDGNPVGGTISTGSTDNSLADLSVFDGNWYLIRKGPSYLDRSYCSKVNSLGIAECKDKSIEASGVKPVASDRVVNLTYSNQLELTAFEPASCEFGGSKLLGEIGKTSGYYSDSITPFNALNLGSDWGAYLFADSADTIKIAFFPLYESIELGSVVAVRDTADLRGAEAKRIGGRLYVSYVYGGVGELIYSEQKID